MNAARPPAPKVPLHRHALFGISAGVGVAALAIALFINAPLSYSIGANAFFATYVVLLLIQMPLLNADYLSRNARATDQPVFVIFAVTLAVVGVATVSLFQLINSKGGAQPIGLTFALASIPLGWFTIHAMTALHYAHVYWMDDSETESEPKKRSPVGGLKFAGKERPEGWDFLYFSTTVGMTSQTSDTEVSATQMRRIVLVHSIVSFFFNTVIVAAAVNLAVSLGS
jgi:uncharacterized membrane protein